MGKDWTASEEMKRAGNLSYDEFAAALEKGRKCPKCGAIYTDPPALSRTDNKTEICPLCGTREALDAAPIAEETKAAILDAIRKGARS